MDPADVPVRGDDERELAHVMPPKENRTA
jgi:hypothetical protein